MCMIVVQKDVYIMYNVVFPLRQSKIERQKMVITPTPYLPSTLEQCSNTDPARLSYVQREGSS